MSQRAELVDRVVQQAGIAPLPRAWIADKTKSFQGDLP